MAFQKAETGMIGRTLLGFGEFLLRPLAKSWLIV